jgi:nucleoside-diphosphate-sugar epimerase
MADRVLVTGACGFIGPYIIEELLESGYAVRATDLAGSDYCYVEPLDCEIVAADLLDRGQALEAFRGVDMVVHTAARMNYHLERSEFELANYRVTVNACEAALASGVSSFVHFSTCDTYGPPDYSPVGEDHPQRPINLYAITKLFGEQAALRFHAERGLPVSVVRPTTVYGPRCVYVMGLFLAIPVMLRDLGITFLHLPRRGFLGNLVHAEDIAGATAFLLGNSEAVGNAYNVSDDSAMPAGELMEVILNSVGIRANRVLPVSDRLVSMVAAAASHFPKSFFTGVTNLLQRGWDRVVVRHRLVPMLEPRFDPGFTAFGRGNYDFDNSRLKGLGYELRHPDFAIGWRETVRWYVEQGWIPDFQPVEQPDGR